MKPFLSGGFFESAAAPEACDMLLPAESRTFGKRPEDVEDEKEASR